MALFQDLLSASKLRREIVSVPEWESALNGQELFIQEMSTEDRDAWEAEGLEKRGDEYEPKMFNMRARLIHKCLVDSDGNKVFPNADAAKDLPSHIGIPLYEKAAAVNKLSKADVEDIAKNS